MKFTKGIAKTGVLSAAALFCVFLMIFGCGKSKETGPSSVSVERRTIVDKAVAVGNIEPLNEISVKSIIPGVVGRMFVEIGDFVKENEPLVEVKPNPTPTELVHAKRNIEMREISLLNLKRELDRTEELRRKNLISDYELETLKKEYEEAALNYTIAKEQLELLEKGRVRIAGTDIEAIIRSPITGFILEKQVNEGDPVVPLTSYQAGTELLKMADMERLIFRGTVDEIDVGKITEQMPVDLQIGALPGVDVKGHVHLISLKARREDNTTVFPIEIMIDSWEDAVLRAGFSANASIIISQKDSVLTVPERVITFRNDSSFVRILQEDGSIIQHPVKTGLSDAIYIEVLEGLEHGQKVLEQEIKEIQ